MHIDDEFNIVVHKDGTIWVGMIYELKIYLFDNKEHVEKMRRMCDEVLRVLDNKTK